jgi:hypothetical protein
VATTSITSEINDPTGASIASVKVTVKLHPRPSYETATGVEIPYSYETTTDQNGQYTLTLTRTADISPAGSYYIVTEHITDRYGGPVKHTIQVGASNTTLYASRVNASPSTPDTYLTQTTGDLRYQQLAGYGASGDLAVIEPDDAAGAGVSASASRADHQHAVVTAAAGAIAPDDAAAEGVATSFSRSDHTHSIVAAAAGEARPNDTSAEGVATSFARSDHKHDREISYGTAAARAALAGTDLYEGLQYRETDSTDKLYTYRGAAWLQQSDVLYVADATARDAVANPYGGMRAILADTGQEWIYYASVGWRKPWDQPWGVQALTTKTSAQAPITTVADISGLSATYTAIANRRIRLSLTTFAFSSVGGDGIKAYITDSSNAVLATALYNSPTNAYAGSMPCSTVITPTAGSQTYKARMARVGGSGNVTQYADTVGEINRIIIEDLGPNGVPA